MRALSKKYIFIVLRQKLMAILNVIMFLFNCYVFVIYVIYFLFHKDHVYVKVWTIFSYGS